MQTSELWALDRIDGSAVDTITNFWATFTGWFDGYASAVTLALLLLLVGVTYLLSVRKRTRA
jgi:hypothetical protein